MSLEHRDIDLIRSLAKDSGLRIRCRHTCGIGRKFGLDLIPCQGIPYAMGGPKEKKKEFKPSNASCLVTGVDAEVQGG